MYKNSTQATTLGYCQERIIVRCIVQVTMTIRDLTVTER
jgi:hypothetical protein